MFNATGRQIAIGDVHGCARALDEVIKAIAPAPRDELIFLGDLIDQGRESKEVLDHILELKRRCHVVLIQGNHEEMLFAARENEKALRYWENCGGTTTINSYRFGGTLNDVTPEHWKLLAETKPFYETERHIFMHANYLPDVPMLSQPDYQLRWALFEPDKLRPHVSGKPVFVGHTEQRDGEVLDLGFATCIDTACWRNGWLTAIDASTKRVWQASRWGMSREVDEPSQSIWLSKHFRAGKAQAVGAK